MAAATRLGYQANFAARALASRRSGLIGVVVETLGDALVAGVVEALARTLAAASYGTLLATTAGAPARSVAATRTLLGRGAEAVVFAGAVPLPAESDLMGAQQVPWACLSDAPGPGPLAIDTGRARGGALAARYLFDLGHRRYAVVARPGAGTRAGVAATLAEGDAILLPVGAIAGGEDPDAARTAMRLLLDGDEPPTAVVCGSDAEAMAAVRECVIRGVAVPGEVSIIGFGDGEFARHAVPGLTTLRISAAAIGVRAAEALLANLAGDTWPPFEAAVKLVVRETTGPPPR